MINTVKSGFVTTRQSNVKFGSIKHISLFSEFLSVDVTFGVNQQRNNLLTFCIIDELIKIFFMPSKQFN